ncbi:MAG: hypothetical protein WC378_00020 [Opitutaceae bacterium]|jgi:hypothetical protein
MTTTPIRACRGQYVSKSVLVPPDGSPVAGVDVMPFDLAPSPLRASVYYCDQLKTNCNNCNEADFTDHCRQLAAMGVTHPMSWFDLSALGEEPWITPAFERSLDIREAAGLSNQPLYSRGLMPWNSSGIPKMEAQIPVALKVLEKHGIKTLYVYAHDEPTEEELAAQVPCFQVARGYGLRVMCALEGNSEMGLRVGEGQIDLAILNDVPGVDPVAWRKAGGEAWVYGSQHASRLTYGLRALARGFTGVAPWRFGLLYGDSYREAIYDLRYAETLVRLGGVVPNTDDCNPDEVREEIIDAILKARG